VANRDKNGRFTKGHTGNPNGRPKREREQQYLDRMGKIVTLKEWEKVVGTALSRAKAGDAAARKWLSDYLLGSPVQRAEISGADGDAIELRLVYVNDWRDSSTLSASGPEDC